MGSIERNEFEAWMQVLRGDIKGVHDRLDDLNGRTRTAEQKIAVLEDRAGIGKAAALGGGVAGVLFAFVEVVKLWMGK